ncbi:LPD5 domain-containing protein [Halomonas sp. ATCH28]|uniref:LPD5 domain-containing protein n=1 Tax=Halomonas gemina TaxID=2945105 RepID=A0ABT0T2T0_9GAMM|nr:LPD38 domain-containing protein [Halomonas gemina]MCL7941230.1 LPD5 domain-containing protein [Halomonas gemina]
MALIDEIRRKNPSLNDRSDDEIKSILRQSPEFQYFNDAEFDAYVSGEPQREHSEGTPGFTGGLAAGIDQVQGMGGGLLMAAGEAMESEGILNAGRDIYQRNMDEAAENDLGFGFTDIRGPGDAWNWARYTAGNLLPMMAASVAGGGAGGIVAGQGAKMLAGAAAKQAAVRGGQALGAMAASTGMETGAMMGETEDLDVSLAHGVLAGSLDAITPVRLLRRAGAHKLADKAAEEISEGVMRDLRRQAGRTTGRAMRGGSLTNLIGEASTEFLQGLINQHANYWVENNGESLLANPGDVDITAMIDEAAAGGLMGGLAGAPAGISERNQAKTQVARIEQAREQTEAQGGDALDQTMAGQQAEQGAKANAEPVDPQVAAHVGNRIQLAMGELDDLQNLAKGASYQGQVRLTNIKRMIDRAEQAVEDGNIAQAERLVGRAETIAANLRGALFREGSAERPARREGEVVDGDEGQAQDGVAGLIGQDGRRLPPGDPSTIFAGGPTADQTQYDPQARNVRRDEGLAAQRQGSERLREQIAGQRPQIPDQGIVYGQGPTARRGNANTGLDQPVADPRFTDTGAREEVEATRARQQQSAEDVARIARTRGRGETAYLPDNTPIRTRFRVMDAAELRPSNTPDGRINPDYPQELQPRDRTNANSQVQVRNIAARLNPERLGSSRDAGTGAPIIGNDGVVESGNGRAMAIAQAYQQGGPQARAYRDAVRRQAQEQGIDPAALDEMERPVLVRERVSNIDRADFARRANESQVAGMTAYEQAQADADSLTADDLQAWAPDQSGDPLAASNRSFQRAFVQRLGNNEAARYTTRDGQASPELGQRMQRAVFAKAYQDADMVEMATEQGDQMRNLTAALQVAAPDLAIARETGSREALDAIGSVNDAARLVRRARQDGISVRELTRQTDAFSEPVPETTALLAVALHTNLRSRRALTEAMRYIGQAVRTRAESERNGALFEDTTTNEDVINAAFQAEDPSQRSGQRSPEGAVQPGTQRGERQPAEGRQAEASPGSQAGQQADALRGEPLDDEWTAFSEASGTRGIPRAEMPQIKAEHRGALANFLSARGIDSAEATVPALSLRPTQREFSEDRVQAAKDREGGDRAILVSADGHVVDGHHQWLARADQGDDVRVIQLDAPIEEVLDAAREFPSSEVDDDAPLLATYDEQELADRDQSQQQAEQAEADRRRQEEQRAKADTEADDFRLSGSDRQADVMAAGGQQDLMGAQPQRGDDANTTPGDVEESADNQQDAKLQYRANGAPFATERSALASDAARGARRQGRQVEAVAVAGGFALRVEREADMIGRQRDTILQMMRATGRRYPNRYYTVAVQQGNVGQQFREAFGNAGNFAEIRDRAGLTTDDMRAAFSKGQAEAQDSAQKPRSDAETEQQGAQAGAAESSQNDAESQPQPRQARRRSRDQQDERIDDFGERIEGARKDQVNQVMTGLDTEVTQSTTLSEAFPAPNYSKLVEEGVDPRAAAFVAVIRNSIPAKPRKSLRLRMWMRDVEQAQSLARMLLDGSRTFDDFLAETQTPRGRQMYEKVEGALRTAELIAPLKPSLYSKAAKWRVDAGAGYSLYDGQQMDPNQTVYVLRDDRNRRTGVWSTDFDEIRDKAANVITSAVQKDDSKPKSRQTPINAYRNTRTGERFIAFQVGSRKIRLVGGFESASAAADYITEHRDQLQQQIDAMRAGPRMRSDSNAPREGVELREGDVTPDDFQAAFGFRGVQFGNYVEGQRRQADLNRAYDALMDLATMMGVPPKAMSLDGTLGLAFGARGKGGRRSAAAHYEPGQVVINLTKSAGPGSLAHEWFHALDNYIPHERTGQATYQTDLTTQGAARAELAERWREMRQALKDSGFEARSKEFDEPRSKPYYGTPIEMAARAFERYTKDKLDAQGIRNDYLVNIASDPEGPYPNADEAPAINAAFDRMMGTLEHRETARGVELYSLNPDSEALKPAPRAEDIASALEGVEELADATVIQSVRELPPQALLGMAIRGVNPADVRGMYIDGELYVIADNAESVQEGVRTAIHEAVGHKGMRAVLGSDLERVMLSLFRGLPNSKEGRQALADVRRDYPFLDPSKREDRITIGEEMVAHLLEKGHRPKAWQRAVAKIRELLRRLFPSIGWTHTDALALGEKSREYLRKQKAERQGDTGELYSLRGKERVAFESQFDDFSDADRAAALKIGQPTMFRSAWQWWKEKTDRWQTKVRQGVVDQYGSLQELDRALYGDEALTEHITQSAWVKARMSKSANGVTEVLLKDSRIEWNEREQVFQPKDDDSMGLGAVLNQLGDSAEIHRFLGWIAGNRADKLRAEGRENLFDDADIDAMKAWDRGNLEDGRSRRDTYDRVFKEFQQYRDDVLAAGEALGVISPEQRAAWRDEFYVPFYRLSEEKGFEAGQLATSGLSRQQAVKKLKGGTANLNNLLENTMMNFHHIIDAGLKNNAARQAIDNAQQLGVTRRVPESGRNTATSTFVMEGGQKVFYEVDDPMVYNAITALGHNGMNSTLMKALRGFKRIFTNTVTVTPQYILANLMRDSIQAPATSDISKNVLGNILVGSETLRDKKMKARMLASGANFSFGHLYGTGNSDELRSGMTRNMRDAGLARSPGSTIMLGVGNAASVIRQGWAKWNDVNNHFENVNRAAIYRQGATEGNQLRASFEARDLMDFSSHGAWPATRVLIDIIPFLNARIQGLDKIYRSGVKPGGSVIIDALRGKTPNATDKQLAGRFWAVTGAVSLAMLALYLENHDEEWYEELEEWEKDTYTHFNVGDALIRIPNPFEVGAIGTMMVRTAEQFIDDEATGELFAQRMGHMITQTFAVGMPQAMQPALDVYANKDSFTNRPIENMGMQNLSPELRKRYNTTAVATGISQVLNKTVGAIGNPETNPLALSPVQVDHLIGGYLGQVGAWGAGMADTVWRSANGHDAPSRRWYEYNPLRRFYRNLGDTDPYTKYGTVFYEGLTETRRAYSDVKELRELGHWEEAKERFEETRNLQALRLGLNRAQRQLSKYNKQIDMIRRSNVGGDLKRQRIDRIQEKKRIIQRTWGEQLQRAKASER